MSPPPNENPAKRKDFYPAHAKENQWRGSEVKRRQKWLKNFSAESIKYSRRTLRYYLAAIVVFVTVVSYYYLMVGK